MFSSFAARASNCNFLLFQYLGLAVLPWAWLFEVLGLLQSQPLTVSCLLSTFVVSLNSSSLWTSSGTFQLLLLGMSGTESSGVACFSYLQVQPVIQIKSRQHQSDEAGARAEVSAGKWTRERFGAAQRRMKGALLIQPYTHVHVLHALRVAPSRPNLGHLGGGGAAMDKVMQSNCRNLSEANMDERKLNKSLSYGGCHGSISGSCH